MPAELPPVTSVKSQPVGGPTLGTARAGSKRYVIKEADRPFWATVNVCDTDASPNALGVRTSVPGNGTSERIYARFTAQWWSGAQQEWRSVGGNGESDWVYVGEANWSARQAGWTFRFAQPPEGSTFVMRGVVEVNWRDQAQSARKARKARKARRARKAGRPAAAWSVVRRRTLVTETGMTGVQGGDPSGLSKAMCLIW